MMWIVGEYIDRYKDTEHAAWAFCGVFDTEQGAYEFAKAYPKRFIGPAEINSEEYSLPVDLDDKGSWEGAYYPSEHPEKVFAPAQE